MRRMSAVATTAALVMVAGLPGTVAAAAPDRVTDTHTELRCEALTNDAGTASIFIGASDAYGSYADLSFWASPALPNQDPPTWVTTFGAASLSADGGSLAATFDLAELSVGGEAMAVPVGDTIGTAALAATLTLLGEPEPYSDAGRNGNHRYSFEGSLQDLATDGAVQLPGGIVFDDLSACSASRNEMQWFATNPDAQVGTFGNRFLSCAWEDESSSVGLYALAGDGGYSEMWMVDATGFAYGFTQTATLTTSDFRADYLLERYDEFAEASEVVGSATASAELRAGDRFNDIVRDGTSMSRAKGQQLLVNGALVVETASGPRTLVMDDAACVAQDLEHSFINTSPSVGVGISPANDTPDGGVELSVGDGVRVRTAGASEYAEASCVATDPWYGAWEIPLGRTVWYTVVGTGAPVTVDTAGSDFDTVLAVYASDGSGLGQVACVDDVVSDAGGTLQAAVTFGTEAGTTYFVQAGGYYGASGTLRLSVD